MALKKIDEKPTITDTILFEINTPDANGCFLSDPYKIDRVVIYYVERDFLGKNWGEYQRAYEDEQLKQKYEEALEIYCNSPTPDNLYNLEVAKEQLESSRWYSTYYYKDRTPVEVIGTELEPAWLSTDPDASRLKKVSGTFGKFTLEWPLDGKYREGDYFICWTWTPLPAGDKLSAHIPFSIYGDGKAVMTIPTHVTQPGKYETLLDRYLPEMYKTRLVDQDLTYETLDKFNKAVAQGFTLLEDLANQIIDLFDANALHESLLVYLSNLFNLDLKSEDPTLWRRQIKEAIPLFKKKGTKEGLEDAFAQAGMKLNELTQYWQVVSPYTWQESFRVKGKNDTCWELYQDRIILPLDLNNFGLWIRKKGDSDYTPLTQEYVEFKTDNQSGKVTMCWRGDKVASLPIILEEGDIVRVLYQYNEINDATEQTIEDYIRSLPLADQRDEAEQEYPPKNWNVRLIEEQDPMFDSIVKTRHPFHDDIVFGYIRTEFPYGENIYNMDEYNGSTRPSTNICHIDKEFTDPCGSCLSSKYSVDVSVEEISSARMVECLEILREYMPFHAQVHSIHFRGEFNEFIPPPEEEMKILVTLEMINNHLSGQYNTYFHRIMEGGLNEWIIDKEDLADKNSIVTGEAGLAYNESIKIIVPNVNLSSLGINSAATRTSLEVLAPSVNAGIYNISDVSENTATVFGSIPEPVDESEFTFNLHNINYINAVTNVTQDNKFFFKDDDVNFYELGVKTNWDVNYTPGYTGGAWKIQIPSLSQTYTIDAIVDNVLILVDNGTLPAAGNFDYNLLDDNNNVIINNENGDLYSELRGRVKLNDPGIANWQDFFQIGDYLYYSNNYYRIIEIIGNDEFYVSDWSLGNMGGISIEIRRRLLENAVGKFGYYGMKLKTASNYESSLGIVNGANPPAVITDDEKFKENYMFYIDGEFYKIAEWNGDEVTLMGKHKNWKTLSAGGTNVNYDLVHFPKKDITIQLLPFGKIDRNSKETVLLTVDNSSGSQSVSALSMDDGTQLMDVINQEESLTIKVTTKDGQSETLHL